MKRVLTTGLLAAILFVLLPSPAFAWGIGVHLQVGTALLAPASLLPAALLTLLRRHQDDFLYGCIAADIILGKKFTHYLEHCHGWQVGQRIVNAADSEPRKAFAWGYLSHLAADTIAHGFFVPYKLVRTYNTALLKHAYWEMRMEASINPAIWETAHHVARRSYLDNDRLLRGILSDTLFSFDTNKKLFNSMVLVNRVKHWQKTLATLERRSRWTITPEERDEYLQMALTAATSLLSDFPGSPYRKADPTGERAIRSARIIRRNLRLLWQEGKLEDRYATTYLKELKDAFRQGITEPDRLLELVTVSDASYPSARKRATRLRTA